MTLQDIPIAPPDFSAYIDTAGSQVLGSKVARSEDAEGSLSWHYLTAVSSDGSITQGTEVSQRAAPLKGTVETMTRSEPSGIVREEANVLAKHIYSAVPKERGGVVTARQSELEVLDHDENAVSAIGGGQASDEVSLTAAEGVMGRADELSFAHEVRPQAVAPVGEDESYSDSADKKDGPELRMKNQFKRKITPSLSSEDDLELHHGQYSSSNLELSQSPPEPLEYEYFYIDEVQPASNAKVVWVNFESKGCRGQNDTDNAEENYEMVQSIDTIDACKANCSMKRERGEPCWGVDFDEAHEECKLWSHPISVQVDADDGATCATLVKVSTSNEWEDFVHTSCRGQNESDNGQENYESLQMIASLDDCKEQCSYGIDFLGVGTSCYGVEFNEELEECKLWVNPITLQVESNGMFNTCSTVTVGESGPATSRSAANGWFGIALLFFFFGLLGGLVTWAVEQVKPELVSSAVELVAWSLGTSRSPEPTPIRACSLQQGLSRAVEQSRQSVQS
jgi:hypothetical protein